MKKNHRDLKDMENYLVEQIGELVLPYIQDHSREEKFVYGTPGKISKDKYGTKYRSTSFLKNYINEDVYGQHVTQQYNKLLRENEKKNKRSGKREKGKDIKQSEAFKVIFRNAFDHRTDDLDKQGRNKLNYVALANIDPETKLIESSVKFASNMEDLLKKVKSKNYFSANMFYSSRSYEKASLRHIVSIVLDFDLDKHKIAMTKEELHNHIKKTIGVAPSLIWDTKTAGNYQSIILLETMAGTDKSRNLYEQIVREMVYKLKYADQACVNVNHLFSIPKSNNDRKIRFYNDKVHNINDFRWLLDERDKRFEEHLKMGDVADFTKYAIQKHPAIQALFNAEILDRTRDNACFTLALVMRELGYSEDECNEYITNEWHPRVKKRSIDKDNFSTNAKDKCIENAYSGKYRSFRSEYVTMVTGIDCELGGYFGRYRSKGIYKLNNAEKVIEFLRQQDGLFEGNAQEIADAIGASKRTLQDVLQKLRKEEAIAYETVRGRGKTTAYELQEKYRQEPQPVEKPVDNVSELQTKKDYIDQDWKPLVAIKTAYEPVTDMRIDYIEVDKSMWFKGEKIQGDEQGQYVVRTWANGKVVFRDTLFFEQIGRNVLTG